MIPFPGGRGLRALSLRTPAGGWPRLDLSDSINAGLVGYWSMDGGTISGTSLADLSGNGSNGTSVGSPTLSVGRIGPALSFNGSTQAISAAINLSLTSIVSLSFWLNWTTFANNDALAFEYTNNFASKNGFIVDPNDSSGTSAFSFGFSQAGGSFWADMFARPSAGMVHHYVLIMDRSGPTNIAYVDGTPQTLTPQLHNAFTYGNFDNSSLYFMSRGVTSLFGAGLLDDVRIHTRALSPAEILRLYSDTSGNLGLMVPMRRRLTGFPSTGHLFVPSYLTGLGSSGPFFSDRLAG